MIARLIVDLEQCREVAQNSWEGQVTWIMPRRDGAVGEFRGTSGGEAWIELKALTNLSLKWMEHVVMKLGRSRETM
jgi:hypothetical protein